MRTIDKLKNLIEKLGGTPSKSPRIKDQVDCLCGCQFGAKSWNDLTDKPFYEETKMVEILPEQSVTGEYDERTPEIYGINIDEILKVKNGKQYTVVINKEKFKGVASVDETYSGLAIFKEGKEDEPIFIYGRRFDMDHGGIMWSLNFGETITLAIYEEQEVVKKLDPKFVGATAYVNANDENKILYKDKNCTELLTVAELKKMGVNIVVYDATYPEQTYIAVNVAVFSDYGSITIIQDNGAIVTYYTNEYYANAPA